MRRSSYGWTAGALIFAVVVAVPVRSARACRIAATCKPTVDAPRPPIVVPASLGFIPNPHDVQFPLSEGDRALFTASGERVSLEKTNGRFEEFSAIFPPSGLAAGDRFRLEYPTPDCAAPEGFRRVSRDVEITAPRPLPTKAGALRFTNQRIAEGEDIEPSCERTKKLFVTNELVFEPSPELVPYLDATEVTIRETGVANSVGTVHLRKLSGGAATAKIQNSSLCNASGTTRYTVGVHVAGASVDPPEESVEVTQDCPGEGCSVGARTRSAEPPWLASACFVGLLLLRIVRSRAHNGCRAEASKRTLS